MSHRIFQVRFFGGKEQPGTSIAQTLSSTGLMTPNNLVIEKIVNLNNFHLFMNFEMMNQMATGRKSPLRVYLDFLPRTEHNCK